MVVSTVMIIVIWLNDGAIRTVQYNVLNYHTLQNRLKLVCIGNSGSMFR